MTETVHRPQTGRSYRGISMHAAGGVHEYAEALLRRHAPAPGRVVEIGSGSGALAARLHDAGYEVFGSDLDIGDFSAPTQSVQWNAAGESTPSELEAGSFDVAVGVEVLEHVENPMQTLRNLRALLKPGGLLVVSTPNLGHPRSRLKFLLRGAPSYFGRDEYFTPGHRMLLPDWLLALHLEQAGFEDVKLSYAGNMGLTGPGRHVFPVLMPVFKRLGMLPEPRTGDGSCTFATARKPQA